MRLAIDAMGNDRGCTPIVIGVHSWLKDFDDASVTMVGNREKLLPAMEKCGLATDHPRLEIVHCTEVVEMSDKFEALKGKKDSSIVRLVELAKTGHADAIVALGSTTAAVGAATLGLRHIPGIRRAGIAVTIPCGLKDEYCLVCDMGANVNAKPRHMADYGIMCSIYSEKILGVKNPRVGLLNVGEERGKGNAIVNETFELLEQAPVNFIGNVEGRDMWNGNCDVMVCDGFTGNAMLKASEGLAKAMSGWLRYGMTNNGLLTKIGALLTRKAFDFARRRSDASTYGGMPLLGINGNCLIGHGASKPRGVYNALTNARRCVKENILQVIAEQTKILHDKMGRDDAGSD